MAVIGSLKCSLAGSKNRTCTIESVSFFFFFFLQVKSPYKEFHLALSLMDVQTNLLGFKKSSLKSSAD